MTYRSAEDMVFDVLRTRVRLDLRDHTHPHDGGHDALQRLRGEGVYVHNVIIGLEHGL